MTTIEDLRSELQSVYNEHNPHRDSQRMPLSDTEEALLVLIHRKIEMALKTRVIEPAYPPDYRHELKYDLEASE